MQWQNYRKLYPQSPDQQFLGRVATLELKSKFEQAMDNTPENADEYASGYLWNEVLLPGNLLNILARYVHLRFHRGLCKVTRPQCQQLVRIQYSDHCHYYK